MKWSYLRWCWLVTASSVSLAAADNSPRERAREVDPEVAQIEQLLRPRSLVGEGKSQAAPAAPGPRDMAAQLKTAAARAKAARARRSESDPAAPELAKLEAKALVNAALLGESSLADQAIKIAGEVRADSRVAKRERFEIAANAELLRVRKWHNDMPRLRQERIESARSLIREFPEETGGYEALLNEAQNQDDSAQAAALATELITTPSTPEPIKAIAQLLVDRHALVGQSLFTIVSAALGDSSRIDSARGRPVVLYVWGSWSTGQIDLAKSLGNMPGIAAVGFNIAEDPQAARAFAAREGLPGSLLFKDDDYNGDLAKALTLTVGSPVFICDSSGAIIDVTGDRGDFKAKLQRVQR